MSNERMQVLWTDAHITKVILDHSTYRVVDIPCVSASTARRLMGIMRDEYERRINELEKRLEQAATYRGIEAHSCPLCHYENGVFIESCQMHKDMEMQRLTIIGLLTERQEISGLQAATLLENHQLQWRVASLEQQLETRGEWEPVTIAARDERDLKKLRECMARLIIGHQRYTGSKEVVQLMRRTAQPAKEDA